MNPKGFGNTCQQKGTKAQPDALGLGALTSGWGMTQPDMRSEFYTCIELALFFEDLSSTFVQPGTTSRSFVA